MALRWTLVIFGSVLITAALVLIATGTAGPVLAQIPWMAPALWALYAAALVSTAAVCGFVPSVKAGPLASGGLAVLGCAAIISGAPLQSPAGADPRYLALFGAVAVAAGSGSLAGWVTSVFVVAVGLIGSQVAQLVATTAFASGDSTLPLITGALRTSGPVCGALAIAGLFTWIVGHRRHGASIARDAAGHHAPPMHKPPESGTVAAPPPPRPPSSVLTMTQSFTVETVSDLKTAGDAGLNDLLSSIVYFMGRNFKAYSGLGFIFDPENRLSCSIRIPRAAPRSLPGQRSRSARGSWARSRHRNILS